MLCGEILFHAFQKFFGGIGKDPVLFPDDVQTDFQFRTQQAEAQVALAGRVDQSRQSQGAPHARADQQCGVEDQIVGPRDLDGAAIRSFIKLPIIPPGRPQPINNEVKRRLDSGM